MAEKTKASKSPIVSLRRKLLSGPAYRFARKALPSMSSTEREAIEAGTVWWDAELFSGNPDWRHLAAHPPAELSDEEQAFLDGPVEELCAMVDDWSINHDLRDLPEEVWAFLREKGFFGMIIPKEHGGMGFSAYAHSCVIQKLATRSLTAAVTAMVPNSLGPAELLLLYGTDEQKQHYLPRLATGEEIPCFALTSEEAGSDAASMVDRGIVCEGEWNGKKTLGMRVTWSKRYITLAPVATVLGLAFKLRDPDGLLGKREDLGVTVALVPTDTPGVVTGRRHWPAMQSFMNGPTQGEDVFMPLDWIIGGPEMAGQGWKMLMNCLAAGRSISLPSVSAGGAKFCGRTSGAYARIRKQFGIPIAKFEGVQEPLARIAADCYLLDACRRVTCSAIDRGEKPAIVGAILKYHATERLRSDMNDAMDIHGGKGICDGPNNYLAQTYYSLPISITVEGANILTRSMMIFGQGVIRCHPWLLKEIQAANDEDEDAGMEAFDAAFAGHLTHHLATWWRCWHRNAFGGFSAPVPDGAGEMAAYYRTLGRACAAFALVSEMSLILLGGSLKRKESISARLGDVLSGLYMTSCTLKRWEEDGKISEDEPVVRYAVERELHAIQSRLEEILENFPGRAAGWWLRRIIFPWGRWVQQPGDHLLTAAADVLTQPGEARNRLTAGIYAPAEDDDDSPLGVLERALSAAVDTEDLEKRLDKAGTKDLQAAVSEGTISEDERQRIERARELARKVIRVDDFAPEELAKGEKPSPQEEMKEAPKVAAQSG